MVWGIESELMGSVTYLRSSFEAGMAEDYPFTLEDLESSSYEESCLSMDDLQSADP